MYGTAETEVTSVPIWKWVSLFCQAVRVGCESILSGIGLGLGFMVAVATFGAPQASILLTTGRRCLVLRVGAGEVSSVPCPTLHAWATQWVSPHLVWAADGYCLLFCARSILAAEPQLRQAHAFRHLPVVAKSCPASVGSWLGDSCPPRPRQWQETSVWYHARS